MIVNKDIGSSAYKNIARHAVLPENGDVAVQGYADYRKVTGWANYTISLLDLGRHSKRGASWKARTPYC
ncbi:hypothetical protein [Proteus vulgaris]|uniref:hypothetical protein n=1 Tax=Proteus vulgaris TaxID=585 RepID=UPI000F5107FA|nr:hypothetical protein [Proteus vulgaris]AYY81066.1 hypothetical protein EGX81_09290 [Proteus vulgaris]